MFPDAKEYNPEEYLINLNDRKLDFIRISWFKTL